MMPPSAIYWWQLASTPLVASSLVRTSPHVLLLPLQLKDRAQEFLPVFTLVSFIDAAVLRRPEFTTGEDPFPSIPSLVLV
jgi:hypothetical protein